MILSFLSILNNPPAVIGVGGSILPLAHAHPCSRKPAAEAEAEIGWLAGWLAGRLAGLGDVSDTSWGAYPGRLPELGWGVLEGGGQKGAKVLKSAKSAPFCTFSSLFAFWAPKCKNSEILLQS